MSQATIFQLLGIEPTTDRLALVRFAAIETATNETHTREIAVRDERDVLMVKRMMLDTGYELPIARCV